MSQKTASTGSEITITYASIRITFDRWFNMYGDEFKGAEEARKVWDKIVRTKGSVWMFENPNDDDDFLAEAYLDDVTNAASEKFQCCAAQRRE